MYYAHALYFFSYTWTYDEHISPIVTLLNNLKTKLFNSKQITADAEINAGKAAVASLCPRIAFAPPLPFRPFSSLRTRQSTTARAPLPG